LYGIGVGVVVGGGWRRWAQPGKVKTQTRKR